MKVLNKQQTHIAEEILLKYAPRSLGVYGVIYALNRNKPTGMEVVVDTWPDFKVIICRSDPQKLAFDMNGFVFDYCTDEQILRKMLTEENVLDFSSLKNTYYAGFSTPAADIIKEVASDKGVNIEQNGLFHILYLPDCSTLICPAVHSELESKISSLNLSHVDLVNQTWKYGGTEQSYKRLANYISNFPSCCITDDQGQPVSWMLMNSNCSVGVLNTVPEHRGKGYAKVVIYTMAKRLHAEGSPIFCHVDEENLISYRLFKSMGFIEDPSYRAHFFTLNL